MKGSVGGIVTLNPEPKTLSIQAGGGRATYAGWRES